MPKTLLVLCFTVVVTCAFSQQEYAWEAYNLSFTLDDDFEETSNNYEEFSASGNGIEFSILPFIDDTIDEDDITTFTMSIAASLELDQLNDISIIELNGFKGGYAEGHMDGALIFIMGLIDPDSDSNFFVILGFDNEDEEAFDKAVNICQSIKMM